MIFSLTVGIAFCVSQIPLQILVENGRLRIGGSSSLSGVPGLFPVRHGPHCRLRIRYQFDRLDHLVVLADGEPVVLPDPAHLLPSGNSRIS